MIELNCSYEESKKILELGYDFSPVCPFYRVVKANSISLYNGIEFIFNLGLIDRLESEVLAELEREQIHPNLGKNYRKSLLEKNIFTEIIPIVPKAVLEACLPDIVDAYHGDLAWYIPRNPLEYRLCRDGDLVTSLLLEEFDSAYEAFIWCHEHHPEELRKKFKEVMK